MSTRVFETSVRDQEHLKGPAGPSLEGFAHELNQAGYAAMTIRRHIRAAEHFIEWTDRKGIEVATLNESFIEKFGHHLHRCRCPGYRRTHLIDLKKRGAHLFLTYLRDVGLVTAAVSEPTTPQPVLLTA